MSWPAAFPFGSGVSNTFTRRDVRHFNRFPLCLRTLVSIGRRGCPFVPCVSVHPGVIRRLHTPGSATARRMLLPPHITTHLWPFQATPPFVRRRTETNRTENSIPGSGSHYATSRK